MTQLPEQGAVGGEPIAPELTPEERLNAAFGDQPEAQVEEDQPLADDTPDDQLTADDLDDEPDDKAAADDLPPIEAPVSWDAEAKAIFAGLPREAQEIVQKREADRERFVQQKSQEAARAKQEIETSAYQQLAQYERNVSEQIQQLAAQIAPQRPNPALLQHDPQAFYQLQAEYEASVAQQRELQQHAQTYAEQAHQREALASQQEQMREHQMIVEHFPEYADPTQHAKINADLTAVAKEMGYPTELISHARAHDILAMRTAAQWKAKAEKLDRLEAKKMEKVRAAKGLPKVSTPGTQRAPGVANQQRYAADREALKHGDKDATQRVLDSFFTKP